MAKTDFEIAKPHFFGEMKDKEILECYATFRNLCRERAHCEGCILRNKWNECPCIGSPYQWEDIEVWKSELKA